MLKNGNFRSATAFFRVCASGAPTFERNYALEVPNVLTAAMQYKNGVLGTLHMNSDSILDERTDLEIYGADGILITGDPNLFGTLVCLQKTNAQPVHAPRLRREIFLRVICKASKS